MPPARSRTPDTSDRLKQFRGTRQPLPLQEKRVLVVLILHLCFLPWALGTRDSWSQLTSLALAITGFIVALWPDSGFGSQFSDPSAPRSLTPFARLLRFPPFWLGLALLGYIGIQACNPSLRYVTAGVRWGVTAVPNIAWLPTSIVAPFERFNLWRQFIIYAAAWLMLCTVGVGLSRRRSLVVLLTALGVNGLVLVLVGFLVRLTGKPNQVLWLEQTFRGNTSFASFIYRNHAAAYLCLIAAVMLTLAARYRERALREHAQSSPALLGVLGALMVFFAVIFTYSRTGTVLLSGYLAAAAIIFVVHRALTGSESSTPRVVTTTIAVMIGAVVIFAAAQVDFSRAMNRFESLVDTENRDSSITGRTNVYAASREMLSESWPRGVGAGGFRHRFPKYLRRYPASYQNGKLFWENAHNDWLQIPIELGVGASFILAGLGWGVWRLIRIAAWRRLPLLLLALGLLQTLANAVVDFPFQNPAILTTWLVLGVIAVRYGSPDDLGRARR